MVFRRHAAAWAVGAAGCLFAQHAAADTVVIKRPGAHPRYGFEAEPHLILGPFDPPGRAFEDNAGIGIGFRGTIELVDNGFIRSINNTVGLGFGADFVHYNGDGCIRVERVGGRLVCDEFDNRDVNALWLPIVMQWNFWLSRNWSVFGEPGLAFRFDNNSIDDDYDFDIDFFVFYAGARWHFARDVALTMRIGYPTFSVGVSFLL